MSNQTNVVVDGVEYAPASSAAEKLDDMPYVVVRSSMASPFAGYLKSRDGNSVVLAQGRRIRYWDGAMELSQLANEGTKKPENCQFSGPADQPIEVLSVSEIHYATETGAKSIQAVSTWAS